MSNPSLADVYRSHIIESCHTGSAIAVNHKGETVLSIGDTERNIFPRSSLKLFQAIPLVESGAAVEFGVSEAEIALCCASHNGESIHTDTVAHWLGRLGLSERDLENGPGVPLLDSVARDLYRQNIKPNRIHHNCSGKHTGMLTLSRHLGVDTRGYSEYHHPTQRSWMQTLSELVDIDIARLDWERDGCGLPAICMPMGALAYGCALFADPSNIEGRRRQAMQLITDSIASHPIMIAGTGRTCTDVIKATGGSVIVKTGAEAVYAGSLMEKGIGFVIKIDDGANRGSEVALGGLLGALGAVDDKLAASLSRHFAPAIYNSQDFVTGKVLPSAVWGN